MSAIPGSASPAAVRSAGSSSSGPGAFQNGATDFAADRALTRSPRPAGHSARSAPTKATPAPGPRRHAAEATLRPQPAGTSGPSCCCSSPCTPCIRSHTASGPPTALMRTPAPPAHTARWAPRRTLRSTSQGQLEGDDVRAINTTAPPPRLGVPGLLDLGERWYLSTPHRQRRPARARPFGVGASSRSQLSPRCVYSWSSR